MAALAKRIPPTDEADVSPSEISVARGVVLGIEEHLAQAHTAAEQIADARKPLAFAASQGDATARERLAELTRDAERNREDIADLVVAEGEARSRLADAEQAQRDAADAALLAHARELADEFIAESRASTRHSTRSPPHTVRGRRWRAISF